MFGKNDKALKEIKNLESRFSAYTDEELQRKVDQLKSIVRKEKDVNLIKVEWFAVVREISWRILGLRPYDVQIIAGLYLLDGNAIEMKTGEGKTLASTLPISLKALEGKGVHVITVNEYLAERDEKQMGRLYKHLGLSSGLVKAGDAPKVKKQAYNADITYLTNSEVVFDYLKDCTAFHPDDIVHRPLNYCIIDEIDSILIDEARTPLILSKNDSFGANKQYRDNLLKAQKTVKILQKHLHFTLDEKKQTVALTEEGYEFLEKFFGKKTLFDSKEPWVEYILNALRANCFYHLNQNYIILKGKIHLVDEGTGRLMPGRRWSDGIHEAVEAKENLFIEGSSKTLISLTYQNFFRMYPSLSGMSGTSKSVKKELKEIYNLKVFEIPTMKPVIRKDLPDKVYLRQDNKWKAILKESLEAFDKGQPVLIGTSSIEKAEFLSNLFHTANLPHNLLTAKPESLNDEDEIIAKAGEKYTITIATNMAGRGTDIILGGNLDFKVREYITERLKKFDEFQKIPSDSTMDYLLEEEYTQRIHDTYKNLEDGFSKLKSDLQNLPYSLNTCEDVLKSYYKLIREFFKEGWQREREEIMKLGGLKVIGTERHESRRIDDQLRGRSGRQGDPGVSQFLISLEDDLLVRFGANTLKSFLSFVAQDFSEQAIEEESLTKAIQKIQETLEDLNLETRKNTLDYNFVLNSQFQIYFDCRKELLLTGDLNAFFQRFQEDYLNREIFPKEISFFESFFRFFPFAKDLWAKKKQKNIQIENIFFPTSTENLDEISEVSFEIENQSYFLKEYLNILDELWSEHLQSTSYIMETISWKAFGQQKPIYEYNFYVAQLFKQLFQQIQILFLTRTLQKTKSRRFMKKTYFSQEETQNKEEKEKKEEEKIENENKKDKEEEKEKIEEELEEEELEEEGEEEEDFEDEYSLDRLDKLNALIDDDEYEYEILRETIINLEDVEPKKK